jgi:hypothetical protein
MLKNKEIDIDTAKAVSQIAQTIINGVKVEVDFVRVTGGLGTGFFPEGDGEMWAERNITPEKLLSDSKKSSDSNDEDSPLKFTPTQKKIIDFLISSGGAGRVGIIGMTRHKTLRYLEMLEERGMIECLDRPEKLAFTPNEPPPIDVSNYCGTWKLTEKFKQLTAKK